MNDLLTQIWSCLVQSSEVYVKMVVNSDAETLQSNANDSTDFEGKLLILEKRSVNFIQIQTCNI
jgi:hypothetical protein